MKNEMKHKLIYRKRYEREDMKEFLEMFKAFLNTHSYDKYEILEEIESKAESETVYVLRADKLIIVSQCIDNAKAIADEHNIDIDIVEREYGIDIIFYMDYTIFEERLKQEITELMVNSDEFMIVASDEREYEIEMTFSFRSLDRYCDGEKMEW